MSKYSNLLRGIGNKTREAFEELGWLAQEEGDALLRQQDSGYLDLTRAGENPGFTRDTPLPRYQPPRGMPASLERINAPTSRRLMDTALEGARVGAHGWYNTEPLFDEFARVLGPEQGRQRFDRYMDYVAATSPRSSVKENIKRASIPYMREAQGQTNIGLLQPNAAGADELKFPQGYGHLAHNLHQKNIEEIGLMGGLDPISKPKVSSFAANLKGNYAPMTLDTHNRAAIFPQDVSTRFNRSTGRNEQIKPSPSKTEYGLLEDYQAELGRILGMDPAQWQSSLWTGGAVNTGVRDARNFLNLFNESIRRTADDMGLTEREAMEEFIKGGIPLSSIMGMGLLADEEELGGTV